MDVQTLHASLSLSQTNSPSTQNLKLEHQGVLLQRGVNRKHNRYLEKFSVSSSDGSKGSLVEVDSSNNKLSLSLSSSSCATWSLDPAHGASQED